MEYLSNSNHGLIGTRLLALTLGLWLLAGGASAQSQATTRPTKKSSLTRSRGTGRFHSGYHAVRERFARKRRYTARRKRYERQAPTPEISPQRAQQIQEALVQAGDLHETPTGLWDTETREAMKQYQASNGFQATGLPDAKSLMKLGLGPHPLPADLDPSARDKPAVGVPSPSAPATKVAANPGA
jgi:hypothetical protein